MISKSLLYFTGVSLSMVALLSLPGESKKNILPVSKTSLPASLLTTTNKETVPAAPPDSSKKNKQASPSAPAYNPQDRYGDEYSNPSSPTPFILGKPSNVQTQVDLDTSMENYTIQEKVGGMEYRPATTMSFQEYTNYRNQQMMKNYWKNRSGGGATAGALSTTNKKGTKLIIPVRGLKGPFGSDYVSIVPNGLVTLNFAGQSQRLANPNIPIRQQKNGNFNFEQNVTLNVVGQIGTKLKLTTNWDTKATFDYQNNVKINYTSQPEDIIQKIEAGTINMPTTGSLIQSPQNLFGVKTKLQFGRLGVTAVAANMRGQVDQITLQGGGQARTFDIKADNYDGYRHFFLGQFFRDHYEQSLQATPNVLSGFQITRVDVYITNTVNNTSSLRDMLAFTDLGEAWLDSLNPNKHFDELYIPKNMGATPNDSATSNSINKLNDFIEIKYPDSVYIRSPNAAPGFLESKFGMEQSVDFEVINRVRKLASTEYTFNANLGYISLVTQLKPTEALGVAYQYTYKGKTYTVGELNGDISNVANNELIILKLLKPQTINLRLNTWNLMMKNIYSLGATNLVNTNFVCRVVYRNDQSGEDIPSLQEGERTDGKPLLQIMGLDRLNVNNDPIPDGNFDYIEGVTIDSKNGKIIFPVVEPFGQHLKTWFNQSTEQTLINKYVYQALYDSTQSSAQMVTALDKYFFTGSYQTGNSNQITLPGINISPGSVMVLAGSTPLVEGTDYTVDYNLGRLTIINQGVLASGQTIVIRFEKQDLFNFRRRTFVGTRLDYKVSKGFLLGLTAYHQKESPQITRVNIGDEPSNNTMLGVDMSYQKDSRFLTKMVDRLPIIQTKAPSSINFFGEGASLLPGHPKFIDKGENGVAYIDDFEGAETPYDFTRLPNLWNVSSTPKRFKEAADTAVNLNYTYHRARLAWYNIDQTFYRAAGDGFPAELTSADMNNHFVRYVQQQEIFPNLNQQSYTQNEITLDLAYFPSERGPYNYNPAINTFAKNPTLNWGGITRGIRSDIDFDNANIQYIEFWMLSPYRPANSSSQNFNVPVNSDNSNIKNAPFTGKGKLYFNLGSISEDLEENHLQDFENGLPAGTTEAAGQLVKTVWGQTTTEPFVTDAFSSDPSSRSSQDVGLDGLSDAAEQTFFSNYLTSITNLYEKGAISLSTYDSIKNDPSGDNFNYFLGPTDDQNDFTVIQRYKTYNNMENNSPVASSGLYTPSNSTLPDNEDLNSNNTLDNLDQYYEYEIDIDPSKMVVGQNNIVGEQIAIAPVSGDQVTWLQFRIPIRTPTSIVGGITGYKSIRFFRVYMTGFSQPVVLRMAEFQMVSDQWRVYQGEDLDSVGLTQPQYTMIPQTVVSTVNIQENSEGTTATSGYTTPPGFQRDIDPTSTVTRLLNEQSLKLTVNDLNRGQVRAVYKNVSLNLLNYGDIRAFIHAETSMEPILNQSVEAFMRLGTDFNQNFYEIDVPLYFTNPINSTDPNIVWMQQNWIQQALTDLVQAKMNRDAISGYSMYEKYSFIINGRNITVRGQPDLSSVQTIMLGIRNPSNGPQKFASLSIWIDELRVTNFHQKAAYAASGKANMKLADLATVTLSGRTQTPGFGPIDQSVSEQDRTWTSQWGVMSNIELDKFIPKKWGIKLPMYISYSSATIRPKYNPLDPDVLMKNALNLLPAWERDYYKRIVLDQTTSKSLNFTNVQKTRTNKNAKMHIYDIENLTFSSSYSENTHHNATLANYYQKTYMEALGYSFSPKAKPIEPFKNIGFLKSPYLRLIKDFNFNFMPSSLTFRTTVNRQITMTQYWGGSPLPTNAFYQPPEDPLYQKLFTFTRNYGLNWNLTKSLSVEVSAVASGVIDEPGRAPTVNAKEYKDSVISNLLRLGRVKNFNEQIGANYTLPLDKFPATNWMTATARYSSTYTWTSGALYIRDTLGNQINNSRTEGVTGALTMEKLYNKLEFLHKINTPAPKVKPKGVGPTAAKLSEKDSLKNLRPPKEFRALKLALRTLMCLKTINYQFNDIQSTSMAGFLRDPAFMGMWKGTNNTDMIPFILGSQNANFKTTAAKHDWVSEASSLNTPFMQSTSINYDLKSTIEPIPDFKIQLEGTKTSTESYNEFYRVSVSNSGEYSSQSPYSSGSYKLSIISIKSAFEGKDKKDLSVDPYASQSFQNFEQDRFKIWNRLGNNKGYDTNSQNILIPAFLAAYTGQNPNKVNLSGTPSIPLPNWGINYTGLTRISSIKRYFTRFNLTHKYSSSYSVGNYTSSLDYQYANPEMKLSNAPPPSFINSSGYYSPIFIIDNVTITESFSPLLGVDFTTKTKLNGTLSYGRDRTLALSIANAQMQEMTTNRVTINIGTNKSGIRLPFNKRQPVILKNEVQAMLNTTINDTRTVLRPLDGLSTVTAGNLNIQFKPTLGYSISQKVNIQAYFERTINAPKVSSSYKRTTTAFGFLIRFTLS